MASTLGRYVIERELGRGGMGAVYVARDSQLGRRAAVKVLLPDLSGKKELVERFFNEARTASQIDHPSIVKIYDHGLADDGAAYIVMELLEGEPLSSRLKAHGALPIPTAVAFARQVANALTAAHRAGIIHRDLKPDNVYLVKDPEVVGGERVKLLDFGIAKLATDNAGPTRTVTGAILGTPHYMSPEQCEGSREVDPRTDLYSLGCMLFQMASGVLPFEGGVGGVIGMHLHVPPPPLRSKCPNASPALEAIVEQLLAKAPEDRFQSAEAVAKALAAPEVSQATDAPGAPLGKARGRTELGVAPTMSTPSSSVVRGVDVRAPTVAAGAETALERAARTASPVAPPADGGAHRTVGPTLVRKPRSIAMVLVPLLVAGAAGAVAVYLVTRPQDAPPAKQPARPATTPVVVVPDAAPAPVAAVTVDAVPPPPVVSPGNRKVLEGYIAEMRAARSKRDWLKVQTRHDVIMAAAPEGDETRDEATAVRTQAIGDLTLNVTKLVKKKKCDDALRDARKGREAFGEEVEALVESARDCKDAHAPAGGAGGGSGDGDGSGSGEPGAGSADPPATPEPPLTGNTGNTGNVGAGPIPKQIEDLVRAGKHEQAVGLCKANAKKIPAKGKVPLACAIAACKTSDESFKKFAAKLGRPALQTLKAQCSGASDPEPPVQQDTKDPPAGE